MDPNNRLSALVELGTPREPPSSLPIDKYFQILMEMFQLASNYASGGDDEKAFVLFLRFISIAVEELPNHDVYPFISIAERLLIDAKIIEAMTTAESLKENIKKRYELEYIENQKNGSALACLHPTKKISMPLSDWSVYESQLGPYIMCNEVSIQPIVFQCVKIPHDLPQTFYKYTNPEFRFAFLYGKVQKQHIIAYRLVIVTIEDVCMARFERLMSEPGSESDYPIIGLVCTSFAEVCKTNFFLKCNLSEIVCVICPPDPEAFNASCITHLINMAPSYQKTNSKVNGNVCNHLLIIDSVNSLVVNSGSLPLSNFNSNS